MAVAGMMYKRRRDVVAKRKHSPKKVSFEAKVSRSRDASEMVDSDKWVGFFYWFLPICRYVVEDFDQICMFLKGTLFLSCL